jgi:hypothetical protein
MSTYHIFWLIAIGCGLAASIAVIGLGCYILRKVVEDLSTSTSARAYGVRLFRIVPGAVIVAFGCYLLLELVTRIQALPLPAY